MTNTIWIALEIFLTLSYGFITAYCIELFKWVLDGYEKRGFSNVKVLPNIFIKWYSVFAAKTG